jgi:hypothetical protein
VVDQTLQLVENLRLKIVFFKDRADILNVELWDFAVKEQDSSKRRRHNMLYFITMRFGADLAFATNYLREKLILFDPQARVQYLMKLDSKNEQYAQSQFLHQFLVITTLDTKQLNIINGIIDICEVRNNICDLIKKYSEK